MTTTTDITLVWEAADGTEPHQSETAGYHVADFFKDGAEWLADAESGKLDVPAAIAAAQAAYRGRDIDGIGLAVEVWDGRSHVRYHLADAA
jgi:hypothetical protein